MALIFQRQHINGGCSDQIGAIRCALRPGRHIIILGWNLALDIRNDLLAVCRSLDNIAVLEIGFDRPCAILYRLNKILYITDSRVAKGRLRVDIQIMTGIDIGIITYHGCAFISKMSIGNSRSDYVLFRCGGCRRRGFPCSLACSRLGRLVIGRQRDLLIRLRLRLCRLIRRIRLRIQVRSSLDCIAAFTIQGNR